MNRQEWSGTLNKYVDGWWKFNAAVYLQLMIPNYWNVVNFSQGFNFSTCNSY